MIAKLFDAVFSLWYRILEIDFGFGVPLASIILVLFTLVMFVRFFVIPIIGGQSITLGSKSDKGGKDS